MGLNPCGWCGLQGCKTQLITKKKSNIISSDCPYHYSKMVYSSAKKSTISSPCTNIPLNCPLCPPGFNGQPRTFWKYNLIHHMAEHHLDEQNRLPVFPREFRLTTHISRLEEEWMGVEMIDTEFYRKNNDIPASNDLLPQEMDDNFGEEFNNQDEDTTIVLNPSRKRGGSVLSHSSSTDSRQPSSSKIHRT